MRAKSVAEVVALLTHHAGEAKMLAGGQSLLPALNLRLSAPALLIDIAHIEALRGITYANGVLRIGAMTTHAHLACSPEVACHAPLLTRAIAHVAHPAIRSRGTIGGSLANADPAAELPACALALQARIVAQGPAGERRIEADGFFTGLFETALTEEEVLVAIEITPAPHAGQSQLVQRDVQGGRHGDGVGHDRKNGRVSNSNVQGTFAGTPTGDCVAKAVKSASFPKFKGSPQTVTYPYNFR